ncbi:DUF5667 domain-containing protein [Nocardioides hwasunensis]|uniref:DUF5667 domain-containing protein n=1 Tax=Nocardioides hwasunensis TaxID=397258 RepID=A0ABR8MLY2_9ACTN|nr:DUF5667 domain-containing protein [Nocardioides hwasunensis]MBD3915802.1 hypothetical protein [Nocardioides hwasunensis]
MTPAFPARRRADEFEALLSGDHDAPLTGRDAARFAGLLEVVADLHALPEAAPRAEFTGDLRERLMIEADTALVRQPTTPSRLAMPTRSRTRDRRIAVLLGGAALLGATATVTVAAQSSLPGESLYGVKRGMEAAEVRLADGDAARGRVQLALADKRLTELEQLARGEGNARLIPETLDDFTADASDGVRNIVASYDGGGAQQDVQHARDFTATSMERLDALQPELPASARDQLLAAGRTLSDLDLEVSFVCAPCQGGITSVPDFLLSSAPADLMSGLDVDAQTLEAAAPISGQDLSGITIPPQLQPPKGAPTSLPTQLPTQLPTTLPTDPTSQPTATPTSSPTTPVKTDPTKPVKDTTDTVTNTVTNTTSTVTTTIDQVTGGALGGLTTGLDDATGGLIGDLTGTANGVTGNLLGNATGGLLH